VSGANDGGNLMASLVASRSLTPAGAALLLFASVSAGPWLFGTRVAHTIVFRVVDVVHLGPAVLLAALIGSLLTLVLAWRMRLPTSTTLALVGALAGAGWASAGARAVVWRGIGQVLGGMVLATWLGLGAGWTASSLLRAALRRADVGAGEWLRRFQYASAAVQGLGYGANDAEKAMGLLALLASWGGQAGPPTPQAALPWWVAAVTTITFGLGMAAGGWRITRTVGFGIFRIRAADALAAQCAAGATVLLAATVGSPVSTTQTTTSALIGVGAARRLSLPRWTAVGHMALAWAVTLPLSLLLGAAAALAARAAR
jgi:PiT family inorganic phosphate transporter